MLNHRDGGLEYPGRPMLISLSGITIIIIVIFVLTQTGHIKTGPEVSPACYCNGQDSVITTLYSNNNAYDYAYDCMQNAGTITKWSAWMDPNTIIHRTDEKPVKISEIDPTRKIKNRHIIRSLDRRYARDKENEQCN